MKKKPTSLELQTENENLKKQLADAYEIISSLKESEERFRTIFHTANAAIAITDDVGKFIKCNELWEKLFGYSEDELKNLTNVDLTHPEDIPQTHSYSADLISGKIKSLRVEKRYITKNKTTVWIDLSITFLKTDNKLNFYGVAIDITDRKNTEFKIQQQNLELQNLNATKDKFISILAHDLRNPFSALIGFSELIKENLYSYDLSLISKYIEIINEKSKNTFNLLENLLIWASSQQKIIPFNPLPVNLFLLANECVTFVKHNADLKNIDITLDIDEYITITVDEEMMNTVLRNLLSNAIKFTKFSGKIKISASVKNSNIEIVVSDNGVGIDDHTKNTIFKLGLTKSKKGTNDERGTGFGLLLCKEFVEKHSGTIWVESEVGKGSNFKFLLPLQLE